MGFHMQRHLEFLRETAITNRTLVNRLAVYLSVLLQNLFRRITFAADLAEPRFHAGVLDNVHHQLFLALERLRTVGVGALNRFDVHVAIHVALERAIESHFQAAEVAFVWRFLEEGCVMKCFLMFWVIEMADTLVWTRWWFFNL